MINYWIRQTALCMQVTCSFGPIEYWPSECTCDKPLATQNASRCIDDFVTSSTRSQFWLIAMAVKVAAWRLIEFLTGSFTKKKCIRIASSSANQMLANEISSQRSSLSFTNSRLRDAKEELEILHEANASCGKAKPSLLLLLLLLRCRAVAAAAAAAAVANRKRKWLEAACAPPHRH